MPRRGGFSANTKFLIAAVSLGGAVAVGIAVVADPPSLHRDVLKTAAVLLVVTAIAELVSIRIPHGQQGVLLTLFEVAVVADIVLLPPSIAALTSVAGLALALIVTRRPPIKFVYNLGQYALGVVPAIALFHTIGHGEFHSVAGIGALVAGMTLFTLANLVTISAILSATSDRPLREVVEDELSNSIAMGIGNAAVGLVAVELSLTRPVLLPAVLAPALALHLAFRGWVKEAELSRQKEEETNKLARILEHSSEGIVLADADGSVLLWSPSMERVTGVSVGEALGKALSYLLRGRDRFGRPISVDVSATAEPAEIEIVATDGSPRWLRVQHGPGFDTRGALSFDVLVVTDVTRQREVEKLKDDFISTVSHELRTPLTPIKGYATLLLRRMDEIPSDRRREALQSIVERTDHLARLVEDLLLASRVSSDAERRLPEVSRQPVALLPVVERAVRSFRTAHPLREFVVSGGDDVVAIGDGLRVEQIVANLISNAVKFSDEGAPVEVRVDREGANTVISVRDEGRGIPADRQAEIFEKFKRLEDPLRMETGGAGLGLFIVRQLSRAMGGDVTVTSEPGVGSTFVVRLAAAGAVTVGEPELPERRAGGLAG